MFIERDKEKECNEVSSLRHTKNYYEIHRVNLFGVKQSNDFEICKSRSVLVEKIGRISIITKCIVNDMEKHNSNQFYQSTRSC